MRKIFFIFLFFIFLFNGFSYSNENYLSFYQLSQKADNKDSVYTQQNNIISLNLLQLYMGEFRFSWEKQQNEKKYNMYGIGVIYMTNRFFNEIPNKTSIPFVIFSDYYYGFKLFYGNKYYFTKKTYWSYLLFFKFERDINLILNYCVSDRFLSNLAGCSGSQINQEFSYRNKYVLGTKFLFGVQNSTSHKIISNFYWGLGIRFKFSEYSDSIYKFDLTFITKSFIVPSIHLGYSFGYNLRKK